MSDLPDQGSFLLGLAQLNNSNVGATAVTNQASTAAGTQLTQAQTQGAQIANQNARLQFQLFQRAMSHISDFSGQDGPTHDADDDSGVTPTSALPAPGSPQGQQAMSRARVTPEMDVGASASDQALIESRLEKDFNVNPMGTQQEQSAIIQAEREAQGWKLSGNKGMSEMADQKVQMLKDQRDMNVGNRKYAAQTEASGHYDKLSSVVNAPEGKAWDTLTAVAPESVGQIQRQHPNATLEELEDIARDTAGHVAGFMHRFTDRPVKVGDDQNTYDEKSGQRVDGIPMRGVSPEKQIELLNQANEVKTWKNSDGTETTEERYKHDGYSNPNLWVTHAVGEIRARNGANSSVEAMHNRAKSVPVNPQPPQRPGQPQPGQPQPGAPGPGSAPQAGAQPGSAPQAGAQPGSAPQAGGAAPQQDNGLLPGINPDSIPKIQSAPVRQGTSIRPADLTTQQETARESIAQQKEASSNFVDAQKTGALIRAAKRETAALANNPRMTGPGSEIAQGIEKIKALVSGQPSDALVNLGSLDKILMGMGAQNVRQALNGQKITNQEFMALLTKGNPNTQQPLATINKLLDYLGAQNDYEQRFQKTKQIALQRGANPIGIDGVIGGMPGADRGDYVEGKVGVRPPLASAAGAAPSAPTIASQADYDKLKKGDHYVDSNGKPHVKGGR